MNELKSTLFDQRKDAFLIDEQTGKMTRKAWLAALGCGAVNANNENNSDIGVKYMTWKGYLISLSDEDYQGEKALKLMPTEIGVK